MSCARIERSLSAYVDGELDGVEMLAVRAHLRECHACNARHDSMVAMKRMLSSLSVAEPRAGAIDRLAAEVYAAPAPSQWSRSAAETLHAAHRLLWGDRSVWSRMSAVAAIAVLAVICIVPGGGPLTARQPVGVGNTAYVSEVTPAASSGSEVTPVLFIPGQATPMLGPDLQLASDTSIKRIHGAAVIPPATDSGGR